MVELSVLERLTLLNILPERGNVATLRIVRTLREDLSFTEEEIETFGVTLEEDRVLWDESKTEARGYTFGAVQQKVIVDALQKLDEEGAVELQHLDLMDKFGIGLD